MWAVYRKSDGAVIAKTRSEKIDPQAMLEEVVRGLVGSPPASGFGIVQVKEGESTLGAGRMGTRQQLTVNITGDGTAQIVDKTPEPAFIQITTDATDFHPVDNVPLIPADGSSFLLVTLEKTNEQGMALAAERDGEKEEIEEIWLRTDHGTLRDDGEPPQDIRSVVLQGGAARFRVYSGTERRLATVQMLSTSEHLQFGGLRVEFI